MSRHAVAKSRFAKHSTTDPSVDPMGAFLVKQRPEMVPGANEPARALTAMERIEDPSAIASLLASVGTFADTAEDDLIFELLYLETLVAAKPLASAQLFSELGALGDEVRDQLLPPGVIDMQALRRRTRRLRANLGGLASRVSAALLMLFSSMPMFAQQARAEGDASLNTFQIAAAPVVRVIDANSGQGLSGVQIKSMEEKLLGVTDATGQATLAEEFRDTDLLSLEKDGYELSLLERTQLSSRNIVSMKPLGDAHLAEAVPDRPAAMRAPVPPRGPTAPSMSHTVAHVPVVTAPKPPTAPKAPQIRLPVRPRPSMMAATTQSAPPMAVPTAPRPTIDHASAPVVALPRAPRPTAHQVATAPTVALPRVPRSAPAQVAAAPVVALPNAPRATAAQSAAAPRVTLPRAPRPTTTQATVAHVAAPLAASSEMSAARRSAMTMPSRPRQPIRVASVQSGSSFDSPAVAIPKRMPAPRHMSHAMSNPSGHHKVRHGETLSDLALKYLGNANRWPELYAANRDRLDNPRFIRTGQTLRVPGSGDVQMAGAGRRYVVRPGDNLFTIAGNQLGRGERWHSIWELNRGKIRDARLIFPGQHITLPRA